MNSEKNTQKELQSTSVNKSRRSFSKWGVAAPVIMTLANRSAWAETNTCTPSGFQSARAGIASHTTTRSNPNWLSPIGWKSIDKATWPVPASTTLGSTTLGAAIDDFGSPNPIPGSDLAGYHAASILNNALSPMPEFFMPGIGAATLPEYQDFYTNCAN